MDHGDAHRLQLGARADAGEQQQLGRQDAAAADDHLAPGAQHAALAVLQHLDADRALAVEQHARAVRVAHQVQVGPPAEVGMDVALAGVPALAVLRHHLHGVVAVLHGAVEVGVVGPAGLGAGPHDDVVVGIVGARVLDPHRPVVAVVLVAEVLVVLELAEVGQHVRVAPARVAERRPFVVVGPMPAHVDEGVDRGAAAEAAADRMVVAPVVQARVGDGVEAPVVAALARASAPPCPWPGCRPGSRAGRARSRAGRR